MTENIYVFIHSGEGISFSWISTQVWPQRDSIPLKNHHFQWIINQEANYFLSGSRGQYNLIRVRSCGVITTVTALYPTACTINLVTCNVIAYRRIYHLLFMCFTCCIINDRITGPKAIESTIKSCADKNYTKNQFGKIICKFITRRRPTKFWTVKFLGMRYFLYPNKPTHSAVRLVLNASRTVPLACRLSGMQCRAPTEYYHQIATGYVPVNWGSLCEWTTAPALPYCTYLNIL